MLPKPIKPIEPKLPEKPKEKIKEEVKLIDINFDIYLTLNHNPYDASMIYYSEIVFDLNRFFEDYQKLKDEIDYQFNINNLDKSLGCKIVYGNCGKLVGYRLKPNPNLEKEMQKYDLAMKKYKKDMKRFAGKMISYENKLKEYEHSKKTKIINQLKRYKKLFTLANDIDFDNLSEADIEKAMKIINSVEE